MKFKSKENLAIVSLVGITALAGVLLTLPTASADTTTSKTASVTVSEVCLMTTSPEGSNDSPHTANMDPGTYQANIGKTTLKVTCNDNSGFSIYAIGYTDDEYGNNVLKASTLGSGFNIPTGTATSAGSPDVSNWAMKVSAVSGDYAPTIQSDTSGSFSSFHAVPSTYTKIASRSSSTDATIGSSIETTYAVYISGGQPADLYTGKVKYTLVHPASHAEPYVPHAIETASGQICYYPNTDDYQGTMGCQSISSSDTSATLLASNFSRSGYGFAGWSDSFDYATNPNAKFYGPNEDITFTAGEYTSPNNGLALYAVWVKSAGSLQDASKVAQLCGTGNGSLTTAPTDGTADLHSVSALTDSRNNQTYAIAKLADGKCWMIENLRLESTASHNSDGTLAQGYDSSFAGLATAESADFSDSTTANSLYSTDGSTTKTIDSTGGYLGRRFPRYNNTNTSARVSSPTDNWRSMYSYGNYYTWHAAIADTTHYYSGDHNTTSICPSGWQIPLGNTSTGNIEQGANDSANKVGGFSYLDRKMGGTGDDQSTSADSLRWRKFPLNYLYSGYVIGGSLSNRGIIGGYWSSTASSNTSAYYFYLNSSNVHPGTGSYNKYIGRAVRCVASN